MTITFEPYEIMLYPYPGYLVSIDFKKNEFVSSGGGAPTKKRKLKEVNKDVAGIIYKGVSESHWNKQMKMDFFNLNKES